MKKCNKKTWWHWHHWRNVTKRVKNTKVRLMWAVKAFFRLSIDYFPNLRGYRIFQHLFDLFGLLPPFAFFQVKNSKLSILCVRVRDPHEGQTASEFRWDQSVWDERKTVSASVSFWRSLVLAATRPNAPSQAGGIGLLEGPAMLGLRLMMPWGYV